jgi:WD40 repeat protein
MIYGACAALRNGGAHCDRQWQRSAHLRPPLPTAFADAPTRAITASKDKAIRLWDLRGEQPSFVTLEGHEDAVRFTRFSRDGTHILTESPDEVRLWDLRRDRPSFVALDGRERVPRSAGFSADGTHVITAGGGPARVWDLRGERPTVVALEGNRLQVLSASLSADGMRAFTNSLDHTVRVWRMFPDVNELIRLERPRLSRCLSQAQRDAYGLTSAQPTSEDRDSIPPPTPDGRCHRDDPQRRFDCCNR